MFRRPLSVYLGMLLVALSGFAADRPRVILLVIDGLRPDVIRPDIMPNLARLKQEGTWCANAHSVFPTVTRVNAASISTGAFPSVHGIVSNTMWVNDVSPRPFDTSNYQNLVKLAQVSGGRTLPLNTLAEILEHDGVRFVAIGSGSTGSAFLLNPQAEKGNGVLISSGLEDGKRAAYPDKINQEILARFGTEKADAGIPSMLWAEKVVRDYVLPQIQPGVLIDWMTEPDGSQHRSGVGSPDALMALKATDEQIGFLLDNLSKTSAGRATNIIVTADHGFAAEPDHIDLNALLQSAGVATNVIVASNGASALIYAKNHDGAVIQKTIERLQQTDGVDVLFTTSAQPGNAVQCHPGKELGWVAGTFSLELIGECYPAHGADVIVTFEWSSAKNAFGYPGVQKIASSDNKTGVPGRSGHGGLNAWMVHTPMLFWGPDFRRSATVEAPVSNVDIAPTILALEGIAAPSSMQGRSMTEAFAHSRTKEPARQVRKVRATAGSFCAELQLSAAGSHEYVDQGQRCGAK